MLLFTMAEGKLATANGRKAVQIDEALLARIARDDTDAFETLYRLTERTVYAFALSILKHHDDALDVMQDTYIKIRSAAHLYKPMGKPMAWIFTIARNLAMSKFRAQKRTADTEPDLEKEQSFAFVTDVEDRLILQTALSKLDQREREIILLHAVSGYSHREIAENLNVPISTALSKYYRGLKKLKKLMDAEEVPS